MIAIKNNCSIKIDIDDNMLGINKYILEIINNVIKNELNIKIQIAEKQEQCEKIICIDRINDYNILKKIYENITFIPYQSIDVYIDSEKFEELFESIYNYAMEMNIDIDVFEEEEGIESLFKYGKSKKKLILTNKVEEYIKYKNENVYINENPFKCEIMMFDDEIIKEIL